MSETPESQQPAGTTAEPTGIAWGDPISPERLAELKEMFERQKVWVVQPNRDIEESVFYGMKLTGADVFWLAALSLTEPNKSLREAAEDLRTKRNLGPSTLHLELADLSESHLGNAILNGSHLSQVSLVRAKLEKADLSYANLDGANFMGALLKDTILKNAQLSNAILIEAHLQGFNLIGAQLHGALLRKAHLEEADLMGADLTRADLNKAHLEEASLVGADLREADLRGARLDGAILIDVQLAGADLRQAYLENAYLRRASFDKTSTLNDVLLNRASLDQVTFDNTNLTVVPWESVRHLGDEREAKETKGLAKKSEAFRIAARAYRSLSVALSNQGMIADAARFYYRFELMERKSNFWHMLTALRSRQFYSIPEYFGTWLISWLLGTFVGYGIYFFRLLSTYLIVVSAFAGMMFQASGQVASLDSIRDAFVLSITSFHGRGVQPPGLTMTDALATLSAVEAIFGLFIESIIIAAFTRRVIRNQ